ncbi:MAG: NADH:ubiquinone reductase (Na(+)-transporting) subunit B [Acidobacteria bacterium]|jgi:Na+-transporting NADH:ubiquinone oxidoreductase subunit B|nr:NADH:ubiquinone reductase (Na(+)-transporting) subunit B [Acidobacteriota bacterium]
MKFLRKFLDQQEKYFKEGGKFNRLYYLWEAVDTFLYTTGKTTPGPAHIRDAMDLKRVMVMVVYALVPTVIMGIYNVGLQANRVLANLGETVIRAQGWPVNLLLDLGIGLSPTNIFTCFLHGLLYFLPIYIVTLVVGGFFEVLFATIRKKDVEEGFFVTSLLFALILPPTIPLWQAGMGIAFAVVIGKEVFGGVGMNIFNPALVGRVFLFFAYPAQISGNMVWVAVDGVSAATPLARTTEAGLAGLAQTSANTAVTWWDAFIGFIPGSIGETSTLACLIGALVLIITGIGSWRIMISTLVGMTGTALLFNLMGSPGNPMFSLPPWWHLVLGGFAFGTVYMATDPVSATITKKGKTIYGILIGGLTVMIRVLNPAYPEGIMLAILFGNMVAPLIDRVYINKNIKRRIRRSGQ